MPTAVANTKSVSLGQPAEGATTKKVRRVEQGVVDRAKTDKTRRVKIEYQTRHPKYGKFIKRRSFLMVHDEKNESGVGDAVEITPCRPMSKTKRWRLVRVTAKAAGAIDLHRSEPDAIAGTRA